MKEPKCPECGNTIFAYQGVTDQSTLTRILEETAYNEKKSIGEHLRTVAAKENKNAGHKTPRLHNLLREIDHGYSKVIVIFCPNCGTILGTAGQEHIK